MNKIQFPDQQVFWFIKNTSKPKLLSGIVKADIAIIGGGMAGLSAALAFAKKGVRVALVERYYCGAGATGKSSGFITPNAELDLSHIKRRFGPQKGHAIWEFVASGVHSIKNTIEAYNISCDYQVQDTLVVANGRWGMRDIVKEDTTRAGYGYESTLFNERSLQTVLGSNGYVGGVLYGDSFGINAYAYCQGLKKVLEDMGVEIYEETPALAVGHGKVQTPQGEIQADKIVVCTDYAIPELGKLKHQIYHAQTILMASAPLSDKQINAIFPKNRLLVWDTDLVYNYYRITGDNRLLLGGATILKTFATKLDHNPKSVVKKLTRYFDKKFPDVHPQFEYVWPGFIGISKDILPIMGSDPKDASLYYVSAATGLPWAAATGTYSAEHIIDKRSDMDTFFAPTRSFPIGAFMHYVIGKRASFALSNFISEKLR